MVHSTYFATVRIEGGAYLSQPQLDLSEIHDPYSIHTYGNYYRRRRDIVLLNWATPPMYRIAGEYASSVDLRRPSPPSHAVFHSLPSFGGQPDKVSPRGLHLTSEPAS